jgi:hypothetical protein
MKLNLAPVSEPPDILEFALAGLAQATAECDSIDANVRQRLQSHRASVEALDRSLLAAFKTSLQRPHDHDYPIVTLASQFSLTLVEVLCLRLIMVAEEDLQIGHAIAQAQAPVASHRPTVGLLAQAFGESLGMRAVQVIGHGAAVRNGILRLSAEDLPLAERQLSVPLPICLALQGVITPWTGTRPLSLTTPIPLGADADTYIENLARQLIEAEQPEVVVVRSGEPIEARAAMAQLCSTMENPAVVIEGEPTEGLAAWLFIHGAVPIFQLQLAPGERRAAPHISAFPGPIMIMAGADGEFESDGRRITDWRIPIPTREQRTSLWKRHVPEDLARTLAREHRHSAARIAALGREARFGATAADGELSLTDVQAAARKAPNGLSALAEMVPDEVSDSALVVPALLKQDLEDLVQRCRLRDGLVEGFGPALQARYRPGVRALLVGPTGTGKTLAASWIATRLGLPLFRVDLSAVTSKYIGDTEKNLSQLLSRAEENEIVLLFDEADSLFGKRTEVRDAHDRFANAQTNFLLQRLENYDGIVLLTSNSRARFDSAFARRLDLILEFPAPGAEERRALWLAHLGDAHTLTHADINRIAMTAELSGGQIRSALLSAAIHAAKHGGAIRLADLVAGLQVEYRKLGRQLPEQLHFTTVAGAA